MLSPDQASSRWRTLRSSAPQDGARSVAEWEPPHAKAVTGAARRSLNVLVAAGDTDVLKRLAVALIQSGHEVGTARKGQQAIERWQAERPDLVILDAALPPGDSLEVCRHIRERSRTPIMLLVTDAVDEDMIVRGLELGVDEVLVSSHGTRVMVAQMQAVLRRAAQAATPDSSPTLRAGDLVVDLEMHQVLKAGAVIRLTRLEFRLLCLLMTSAGQVVPYMRLVHDAWGYTDEPTPHLLRAHMSRLRRKLGLVRTGVAAIESILGIGYRLNITPARTRAPEPPDLVLLNRSGGRVAETGAEDGRV